MKKYLQRLNKKLILITRLIKQKEKWEIYEDLGYRSLRRAAHQRSLERTDRVKNATMYIGGVLFC